MCSPRCSRWLDHLRPKLLLGFTATPPDPGQQGERWRPLVGALPWAGLLLVALLPSPWGLVTGVTLALLALLLGQRLERWDRDLRGGDGCPPRNRN